MVCGLKTEDAIKRPTFQHIAQELRTGLRTLQRRLTDASITFQQLVEDSRIESTRSTPPVEPEVFHPRVATIETSGRQAFVVMVQAAHLGERNDLALLRTLHWS